MSGLRVAVFGTGSIGWRHLQVLAGMPGVNPLAVTSRAGRRDDLEGRGFLTADPEELPGPIDGAIIATETRQHAADFLRAKEAGARVVLVEKPALPDLDGGCPDVSGAKAFVGFNLRFSSSFALVQRWLGRIGTIHAASATARLYLPSWRTDRPYGESYSARGADGGVLRDLSHEIDMLIHFCGRPEGKVMAWLGNTGRLGIEGEETATVRWVAQGGVECLAQLDYITPCPRRQLEIFGSEGRLVWNLLDDEVIVVLASQRTEKKKSSDAGFERSYILQDEAFVGVINGCAPPSRLATWAEGLGVVSLCDAARSSSSSGLPQDVKWI